MLTFSTKSLIKKSFGVLSIGLLLFSGIPLVLAVDPPTVNEIISPIDATKTIISGNTEPGYKVYVTGGAYEIAPVYADEEGYFEITVALAQETINNFSVKVENELGEVSETVQVTIMESAEEAAEAESSGGGDHTAPAAPTVDETPETIDANTYTFTGTGEKGGTIKVTGADEGTEDIDTNGKFEITLTLDQNAENTFSFSVLDDAGNISPSTKVTIEELSQVEISQNEEGDIEIVTTDVEGETEVIVLTDIYGHWSEDYIVELVAQGYMEGYDDGTFRPDYNMNRAEFVKTLLTSLNFEIPEAASTSPFTDVAKSAWYARYVEVAKEEDITDGYDDGTFRPGENITRAEAVKMLLEGAEIDLEEIEENPFSDVEMEEWYAPYVLMAYNLGIVSGYEDGRFGINDPITRGQVTKIIVELQEQL